jgi:hypothetical protein
MNHPPGKAADREASPAEPSATFPDDFDARAMPAEARNFIGLSVFQVLTRVGWIFKTESIIVPAVLDMLGGSAWLRGCLPLLNRLGLSVPPLLLARRVHAAPRKKLGLFAATAGMAVGVLLLALMWRIPQAAGSRADWRSDVSWAPALFLTLYGLFFACTGMHSLIYQTLQGKLIGAARRGRLLSVSNVLGSAAAIAAAWWLLPGWLAQQPPRVDWVFGFAGVCFFVAAASALRLEEPADDYGDSPESWRDHLSGALAAVRENRNFARLCLAAGLSGFSVVLFPHYQALGRERLHLQPADLVFWVVVQNVGTGVFSLLAGPLADSRGNRIAVRLSLLLTVLLPATAVALTHWGQAGHSYYFVVFFFLGLTPVTMRLLNHYTLEVCKPADHPRFLSTLNVCQALPALLAPGVGAAIDVTSLETVFLAVAALNALGWLLTMKLDEPRRWRTSPRDSDDAGVVDSLQDL